MSRKLLPVGAVLITAVGLLVPPTVLAGHGIGGFGGGHFGGGHFGGGHFGGGHFGGGHFGGGHIGGGHFSGGHFSGGHLGGVGVRSAHVGSPSGMLRGNVGGSGVRAGNLAGAAGRAGGGHQNASFLAHHPGRAVGSGTGNHGLNTLASRHGGVGTPLMSHHGAGAGLTGHSGMARGSVASFAMRHGSGVGGVRGSHHLGSTLNGSNFGLGRWGVGHHSGTGFGIGTRGWGWGQGFGFPYLRYGFGFRGGLLYSLLYRLSWLGYGGYGYAGYGYGGYGYGGYGYGANYGGAGLYRCYNNWGYQCVTTYPVASDATGVQLASNGTGSDVLVAAGVADSAAAKTAAPAEAFSDKGEAAFKAGDYSGAVYAWRHAVIDDAQNPVLTMLLAQSFFATGQFDEAAGATQMAMQSLSKDQWGVVVANYRELYTHIGDYTNQLRALEKAVSEKPTDPARRFLLGFHYGYLGYPQQAIDQLDKALKVAPRDELAKQLRDEMKSKLPKGAASR